MGGGGERKEALAEEEEGGGAGKFWRSGGRDSRGDSGRLRRSSSLLSGLSGSFWTQVSRRRSKGGSGFYVGGQSEELYPSPLPHIRDFGGQAPPPCTFQGYRRRRLL